MQTAALTFRRVWVMNRLSVDGLDYVDCCEEYVRSGHVSANVTGIKWKVYKEVSEKTSIVRTKN